MQIGGAVQVFMGLNPLRLAMYHGKEHRQLLGLGRGQGSVIILSVCVVAGGVQCGGRG